MLFSEAMAKAEEIVTIKRKIEISCHNGNEVHVDFDDGEIVLATDGYGGFEPKIVSCIHEIGWCEPDEYLEWKWDGQKFVRQSNDIPVESAVS